MSYIIAVSFIGGGNRSTRRKPPTCLKLLTNFIILIDIIYVMIFFVLRVMVFNQQILPF